MPASLQRLPGGLQQQPLLGIHRQRLARADAEEGGVELAGVVQEPALAGVARAGALGVGVVERVEVPAAVGGEARRSRRRRRRAAPRAPRASATPPGKRQPMPTIAIGSRARSSSCRAVVCAWCRSLGRPLELVAQLLVVVTRASALIDAVRSVADPTFRSTASRSFVVETASRSMPSVGLGRPPPVAPASSSCSRVSAMRRSRSSALSAVGRRGAPSRLQPVQSASAAALSGVGHELARADDCGERGWRGVVEDERCRQAQPVAVVRRLRSSTAASESKPSSLKVRSGVDRLGGGVPSTVATCSRTSVQRRAASRSASGSAGQALARATPRQRLARRAVDAHEAAEQRRQHAGARPGARSAAVSRRTAPAAARPRRARASKSCRPCSVGERRRSPLRASRAQVGLAPARPVMPLACAHRPQASEVAGRPRARRCCARASRKVLAAA